MTRRWFRRHVSRAAQLTATRPSYAAGIRAAIATVVPIIAGEYFGWHTAVWMGLAGFNVSLADRGGSFRARASAMTAATFYGLLAAGAGALAGRNVWTAVAAMAIWSLATGLARVWGATATAVGVISLATFIVSVATPATNVGEAWERGGAVAAGSAFAIAVALLVWPIRIFRPARLAVARAYRALAAVARTPEDAAMRGEARAAVDGARRTLATLRRGVQGESSRGEKLLVLAESADRLLSLLKKGRREDVAPILAAIADAVERERSVTIALPLAEADPLHDALTSVLTALAELEEREWHVPAPSELKSRYWAPLAANLTWNSAVLRHALRVAVAGSGAVALTSAFHITRGYWMTLTVIIILQPYTSTTLQKGLQRVAGTILGGVLAAFLITTIHAPLAMVALVFVGAAITVAFLRVNYALYSLFLTPTFILLAELNALDRHLVAIRILNTAVGAVLAYLAAAILWPASERGLVREELAATLHALADYTGCVECDDENANEARRAFLLALQNADASLQRLLGEPPAEEVEALMAILVYIRRYALALNALQSAAADRLRLAPLARFAVRALTGIANAIAEHHAPRALAEEGAPPIDGAERLLEPLIGIERAAARL